MMVGGKKSRAAVDRRIAVADIEGRRLAGQTQIGFVERSNRPDVLPVAVEQVDLDFVGFDRLREDFAAEVLMRGHCEADRPSHPC